MKGLKASEPTKKINRLYKYSLLLQHKMCDNKVTLFEDKAIR